MHAIGAYRKYFNSQGLKFSIANGYVGNFSRSDKGEISWIKTQYYPFTAVIAQPNFLIGSLVKGIRREIRRLLGY
jgi:hypothetical protein